MPFVQKRTPAERLAEKAVRSGACLLWTGTPMKNGYATISIAGRPVLVHRLAYQLTNGEIPDSLLVRHTCDVRNCIEPTHLIPGTNAQNTEDMLARRRSRRHTQKVCKHGHERTPENIYVAPRGTWECYPCRRKRWQDRKKAA